MGIGEGGIRTPHDPLVSVSCRFDIAAVAVNATYAAAPCTRLHPRTLRPIRATAAPRAGWGRPRSHPRAPCGPGCRAKATAVRSPRHVADVPESRELGKKQATRELVTRARGAPHRPVCVRKGSPRSVRDPRLHRDPPEFLSDGTAARPPLDQAATDNVMRQHLPGLDLGESLLDFAMNQSSYSTARSMASRISTSGDTPRRPADPVSLPPRGPETDSLP